MSEKSEFTRKELVLLSISLVGSIVSPIIVAVIIGTGRFSSFNPSTFQLVGLLITAVVFIIAVVFLVAKWSTTFEFMKLLLAKLISYRLPIIGFVLLLVSLWGIYLTNSHWIMLNAIGLTIAATMLYRFFILSKRKDALVSESKFLPVLIPPGVGNKYFGAFYIDPPSGDVLLGGAKFHLQSETLVFDTNSQLHTYFTRDDGCNEVVLGLRQPERCIKSVYILINSGNSRGFYLSEKVGEIKLVFSDAPPIIKELILGRNLREWCIGAFANLVRELSDPSCKVVWQGVNKDGTYAVIDCLKITVPNSHLENSLVKIVFVHKPTQKNEDTLGVQYFVSGISLETITKCR